MFKPINACGWLPAVIAATILMTGCSEGRVQRVPVSGRVLIDGEPLTQGFIQVVPADERAASGEIGPDGRFQLTTYDKNDGCVVGTHKVSVIANESQGPNAMKWFAPKKYADTETSELTLEVSEPRDDVEILLSWDGGKPFVEQFAAEGAMPAPE